MGKSGLPRFEELDFLRGIAVVSMVIFHAYEDYLFLKEGRSLEGDWYHFWGEGTAILFLTLFGVTAYLNYIRSSQHRSGFSRWLRKGGILFGWGVIITLVTKVYLKEGFVVFGILHLMGVGSVLIYPLLSLKYFSLTLGSLIILAGNYLSRFRFNFAWLVWLGVIPEGFCSIDYFPVIPWLGYILVGIFGGGILYSKGNSRFMFRKFSRNPFVKGVSFLGRCSLWIYIVHQPLLLVIIDLIFFKKERFVYYMLNML